MPKKQFNQLDATKQQVILNAAMEEFSSFTFFDASINQIVKKSLISRGSFYLYFQNKEDIYFFLLESLINKLLIPQIKGLIEKRKDIESIYETTFLTTLELIRSDQYGMFFKNLYLSYNPNIKERLDQLLMKTREELMPSSVIPPKAKLKIDLLKMITHNIIESLVSGKLTEVEAKEKFMSMKKMIGG